MLDASGNACKEEVEVCACAVVNSNESKCSTDVQGRMSQSGAVW